MLQIPEHRMVGIVSSNGDDILEFFHLFDHLWQTLVFID